MENDSEFEHVKMKGHRNSVLALIKLPKQKFRRFRNFSLTAHSAAQQPKWQNSCSKMWSIEQLYIELGLLVYFQEETAQT